MRLAQNRKRRAPITVLSQAAVGATIICAAEKIAVSQAPSSKPRLNPPRISARPKVVMRVLRVETKAPISTAATPTSGFGERMTGALAGAATVAAVVTASYLR